MSNTRKRPNDSESNQSKRIKYTIEPINAIQPSTKPTTLEDEVIKLQNTINYIIPTINTIIKNGKKITLEVNKTNTRVNECEKSIKYLHKHVHRKSITIKNLGIDIQNKDEAYNEVSRLCSHILNVDCNTIKTAIENIEPMDHHKSSTSKPSPPITIKVDFNNENIPTSIIKEAKKCKDFVRKDKTIKFKIFIQEYKSPIDAESEMELSHTIQLIYLYYNLLKKKDPTSTSPTVTKHYKKLKVDGTNTNHLTALKELTGFTEEQLITFRHLKRTKSTTEQLEAWIKKEQPNKF